MDDHVATVEEVSIWTVFMLLRFWIISKYFALLIISCFGQDLLGSIYLQRPVFTAWYTSIYVPWYIMAYPDKTASIWVCQEKKNIHTWSGEPQQWQQQQTVQIFGAKWMLSGYEWSNRGQMWCVITSLCVGRYKKVNLSTLNSLDAKFAPLHYWWRAKFAFHAQSQSL